MVGRAHLFWGFGVTSFERGGNMPFIRGRYHINAIAGEALEAAREAEAALLALQRDSAQSGGDGNDEDDETGSADGADKGPIHRVEIEAAELVPSHSGRAQRGFVAHVHREAVDSGQAARRFPVGERFAASSIRVAAIAESGASADGGECVASGNACVRGSS
jgi:hypothetical protein